MAIFYDKYLRSPYWSKLRLKILDRNGRICEVNGCHEKAVQVHHLKYNLYNENPDDLVAICENHHKVIHNLTKGNLL